MTTTRTATRKLALANKNKSRSGLDVLVDDIVERSVLDVTCIRDNSHIRFSLELVTAEEDREEDREDELECSLLHIDYKPEGSERQQVCVRGWDIAALLDGLDKLRPELDRRIKSAQHQADRDAAA